MQKEKISELIKSYINEKIDTDVFCYQYEDIFVIADGDESITVELENLLMSLYDNTIKRYSPYENDIKSYQFYIDENSVKSDVIEFYNVNKDKFK